MKIPVTTAISADMEGPFNESQWLRILFVIADTEQWLQQLQTRHFYSLPLNYHKKLLRKSWYLSVSAMAHILERHYYKINRHPGTGKFTIPIAQILFYIKEAGGQEPQPIPQTGNLQRTLKAKEAVGYDRDGVTTRLVTVLSDTSGHIITAFPGELDSS